MTTIYKYQFTTTDVFTLEIPKNGKILSVNAQNETPCIWAMVDTEAPIERRFFEVFGIGHPIDKVQPEERREFIGTYLISGGFLVFHLFELILPY